MQPRPENFRPTRHSAWCFTVGMSVNTSRLAAGAAALVLGAGLSVAAVPASAATGTATHTVTYSPGVLPVTLPGLSVPGISPSISAPDGGAVHTGDTIVFKTTGSGTVTIHSTTANWSFSLPVTSTKPASVTVPGAGTFGYGVGATTATFTSTAPSSSGGSTPPPKQASGGGSVGGLLGGQQPAQPPAAGSGGAGSSGSGAAGSGVGSSGAAGSAGSGGGSGSFDSARFGSGSGDFPNLPGGVLAPEAPQLGSSGGGLPPEIATFPTAGATGGGFNEPAPASTSTGSRDTLTNASQVVGASSSVSGPAAVAAALIALVVIGLARAWVTHRPLHRH